MFRRSPRALIILAPVVLLLAGCRGEHREVARIMVSCRYASPQQVESQIAVPLEYEINGLAHICAIDCYCHAGRLEVYLVFDAPRDAAALQKRIDRAVGRFPTATAPPVVESVAEGVVPNVDRSFAEFIEVIPDSRPLTDRGVTEEEFWSTVAAIFSTSDNTEERIARLRTATIRGGNAQVPFADLAVLKLVEQPGCIVRRNSFRE